MSHQLDTTFLKSIKAGKFLFLAFHFNSSESTTRQVQTDIHYFAVETTSDGVAVAVVKLLGERFVYYGANFSGLLFWQVTLLCSTVSIKNMSAVDFQEFCLSSVGLGNVLLGQVKPPLSSFGVYAIRKLVTLVSSLYSAQNKVHFSKGFFLLFMYVFCL